MLCCRRSAVLPLLVAGCVTNSLRSSIPTPSNHPLPLPRSFTPAYTAAVAWDSERLLLRRETGQGMYGTAAWFTAKTLTVVPVQVVQTTLFCVIT